MSDLEPEYEVEVIQRAKVDQDKRGRKTWKYYVKWKGYGQDGNTWEPYTSFVGSEHFIENFWARVRSERDHTVMRLFKPGEEMFPVGPPGKMKSMKKSEPSPSKEEPRTSPRRPAKRKEAESEVDVHSLVEEEIEDDSEPAPTRQRKRRASAIEQPEDVPSTKRSRRSRVPVQVGSDDGADEIAHAARALSRRPSTSRTRTAAKKPELSGSRPSRASASSAKPSARSRSTVQGRRKASIKPSDDVIEIDSDSDEPAAPPPEEQVSKSGSTAYVEVPSSPTKTNGSSKKSTAPATIPSATPADDHAAVEPDSLPVVRSRPTRKSKSSAPAVGPSYSNGNPDPSPSRRRVAGSRAGPGRSSKGIVAGKTSASAVIPGGGLKTPRKFAPTSKAGKAKQHVPEEEEDADAMAVDYDPLLAPLTNDDLDHLAKLTQTPAPASVVNASDYDGTSERDAEGESDHESAGEHQSPKLRREKDLASVNKAETSGKDVEKKVQEEQEPAPAEKISEEAEVVEAPKQVVINPPDTAIGGNLERRNSFVPWKAPTIFDNISTSSFHGTADVPGPSAESSQPILSIPINPSVKLFVKLQDIHPPADSTRKPLDEMITQQQTGPPGKFYKGQAAEEILKAFGYGGSSARAVLKSDADASEKEDFNRLQSYLKEGNLFIAIVGSVIFAFCSSNSADFTMKLGISPNLVGLGDNILVTEVVIADDAVYCDAVMNAEDIRW
ncbi:hypothetical protein PHLGIDRAFT_363748 [Phlebiopsis gigantea 11061_1 CR5-6]|uniref:Chromo domain-containing protein n=1 Tax=Phlebiopsis gigantea (strain 11061_1 CR5-6) TaxID=745531 RepID=A0A0C3PPB3_PHLG1|nr:hypothetical protein PHLGIDRAFT_363748 [Phlebiopsis gigantea 11061_1 CR5-6]